MEMILLGVTLTSSAVAILMGGFAWRLIREERRRSEARIAALAAAIGGDPGIIHEEEATAVVRREPVVMQEAPPDMPAADWAFRDEPIALGSDMFTAAQRPAPSRFRLIGIAAAGAVVILAIVAASVTAISVGRGAVETPTTPATPAAPAPAPAAAPPATPLELIALGHERQPDRLTVRGVVRNPTAGAEVRQLNAVVLLFDHDGGFVATARAPIDGADLAPGAERTFVVSIPASADVERYRVSFRSDDHVVPHVDHRSRKSEI
jgi:hypothetical protein